MLITSVGIDPALMRKERDFDKYQRVDSVCSFGLPSFSLSLLAVGPNILFILKDVPLGCLGVLWVCV